MPGRKRRSKTRHDRLLAIIDKLEGREAQGAQARTRGLMLERVKIAALRKELVALSDMDAQARGLAFERLLKDLFDTCGLKARDPFRLRGEQIDGSFVLGSEIYLLEAKWQSAKLLVVEEIRVLPYG